MRPLLPILAAAVLVAALLSGCGHAASPVKNPWVGTWQAIGQPDLSVVISKHGSLYAGQWVKGGKRMPDLLLHDWMGDHLYSGRKTVSDPLRGSYKGYVLHLDTFGPEWTINFDETNGPVWKLVQVSDSTASPTPTP
jgi:hypothetical protein